MCQLDWKYWTILLPASFYYCIIAADWDDLEFDAFLYTYLSLTVTVFAIDVSVIDTAAVVAATSQW